MTLVANRYQHVHTSNKKTPSTEFTRGFSPTGYYNSGTHQNASEENLMDLN
jgi:hypothetical protein